MGESPSGVRVPRVWTNAGRQIRPVQRASGRARPAGNYVNRRYVCLKRLRQHQRTSTHTKEPGQRTESPENRASPNAPDSAWRSVVNPVLWGGLLRFRGRMSSDKPATGFGEL